MSNNDRNKKLFYKKYSSILIEIERYINNEPYDIEIIKNFFLLDNSFKDKTFNKESLLFKVIGKFVNSKYSKSDIINRHFSTKEELYNFISKKENKVCEYGKYPSYSRDKTIFEYCGNSNTCECAKQSLQKSLDKIYSDNNIVEKIVNKRTATLQEKYGVDNISKLDSTKDKIKNTNLEKGNHICSFHRDDVKNKLNSKLSNLKIDHQKQIHFTDNAKEYYFSEEKFKELTNIKSPIEISEFLELDYTTILKRYKKFNILIPRSTYENEIINFLNDNNIKFLLNDRKIIKPKELDFYLPDYKIAIEFNGEYYHSSKFIDKNYHFSKHKLCSEQGIQLLSIFQSEWQSNKDKIKNKILYITKKSKHGVYARNTTICKIENKIANKFLDKYHIQNGTKNIIYSYGAYHNNELIGVICYNKQRTTGDIELIRFCSNGENNPGLFSKLLNYSIKDNNWSKIISFSDNRYSDGNLYRINGFVKEYDYPPSYYYFYKGKIYHKRSFTKTKLLKLLDMDNKKISKSERELANIAGIERIYDCGKIKWVLEPK